MVAVSAVIPNVEDVAVWLSNKNLKAVHYKLDESHRPVKLHRIVLGFACNESWSDFRFDLSLNYKVASIIFTYCENKPTLVFASTRKGAVQTALVLSKEARFVRNPDHKQLLSRVANGLRDNKLRDCVFNGIGYHHAGIEVTDRRTLEALFTDGNLPVLVSTSTLAMGVNLPAHLVIIKSTSQYVNGTYKEYPAAQLLQMIGRAGRPQFDDHATAVIMTKTQLKSKYENLVTGKDVLESHLHKHLIEHLNAEIVLGTIQDSNVTLEWLRSTFLHVRVQKNLQFYGLPVDLSVEEIELKLQEMCMRELNALVSTKLIEISDDNKMHPTHAGKLMARYCVSFLTMKSFLQMKGDESLKELLDIIADCKEFSDIKLRTSDKLILNSLNKTELRFPIKGKVNTGAHKISCLFQSTFSCSAIGDYGLSQEATKVIRTGQRLTKCLFEYSFSRKEYELLLNALILTKVFNCHLWENSKHITRQLERIGPALANALSNAKITTFTAIENANSRYLEMICNRNPPFGNKLREQAMRLPRYELIVEQQGKVAEESSFIKITVTLANFEEISLNRSTTPKNHSCLLLIGNSDNSIVVAQRVTDSSLLQAGGQITRNVTVKRCLSGDELSINCISETWAGLDVQSSYTPRYLNSERFSASNEPNLVAPHKTDNEEVSTTTVKHKPKNIKSAGSTENNTVGSKRNCLHSCSNKGTCKHNCCKVGIASKVTTQDAQMNSRLLPNPKPLVKRLKLDSSKKTETNTREKPRFSDFQFKTTKPKFTFQKLKDQNGVFANEEFCSDDFIQQMPQDSEEGAENKFGSKVFPLNELELFKEDYNFGSENSRVSFDLLDSSIEEITSLTDHNSSYPSYDQSHFEGSRASYNPSIQEREKRIFNVDKKIRYDGTQWPKFDSESNKLYSSFHNENLLRSDSKLMLKLAQVPGASNDVANLPTVKNFLNLRSELNANKTFKPVADVKPMICGAVTSLKKLPSPMVRLPSSFAPYHPTFTDNYRVRELSSHESITPNNDWDDLHMFQKYRHAERNSLSSLYNNGSSFTKAGENFNFQSQYNSHVLFDNFDSSNLTSVDDDNNDPLCLYGGLTSSSKLCSSESFNLHHDFNRSSQEKNEEFHDGKENVPPHMGINHGLYNVEGGYGNVPIEGTTSMNGRRMLSSNLSRTTGNCAQNQINFSQPQKLNIEISVLHQDSNLPNNVRAPACYNKVYQKVKYKPKHNAIALEEEIEVSMERGNGGLRKGILKNGNCFGLDVCDVKDLFEGII